MITSNINTSSALFKQISKNLTSLYGQREAESLAVIIIEYFFEMGRTQILMDVPFTGMDEEILGNLNECIERLKAQEPIQHILGETEFYGLPFYVSPDVLIPRPETEELVNWVIEECKNKELTVLDIGTGSGCIPVVLKKEQPQFNVFGLDVSSEALTVANDNAELNQVDIKLMEHDILSDDMPEVNVDVIVSNPPYITLDEKQDMKKNVLEFDPSLALFVTNEDPLVFYRVIGSLGLEILSDSGKLFFEINENFGNETVELLQCLGYKEVILKKDLNDKDRMILALK